MRSPENGMSEEITADPQPWIDDRGHRWFLPITFQDRTFRFDPRPEFGTKTYAYPDDADE